MAPAPLCAASGFLLRLLLFAASASTSLATIIVRLAGSISLSGPFATESREALRGLQLLEETLTNRSMSGDAAFRSSDGRDLSLMLDIRDDGNSESEVVKLYETFVSADGDTMLLGPVGPSLVGPAVVVARNSGRVMMHHSAFLLPGMTGAADGVFSVAASASDCVADTLLGLYKAGFRTLGVAWSARDSPTWTAALCAGVVAQAETLGFRVALSSEVGKSGSFAKDLWMFSNTAIDVFVSCNTVKDAVGMLLTAKALGMQAKAIVLPGATSEAFVQHVGIGSASGLLSAAAWARGVGGERPCSVFGSSAGFAAAYAQRFGELPSQHAAGAAAAGISLLAAFAAAGSSPMKEELLRQAITDLEFSSFYGVLRFGTDGVRANSQCLVQQVQPLSKGVGAWERYTQFDVKSVDVDGVAGLPLPLASWEQRELDLFPCPLGHEVDPNRSSQACVQCPVGKHRSEEDLSCHTCTRGSYAAAPGQAVCKPCADGAECGDGRLKCSSECAAPACISSDGGFSTPDGLCTALCSEPGETGEELGPQHLCGLGTEFEGPGSIDCAACSTAVVEWAMEPDTACAEQYLLNWAVGIEECREEATANPVCLSPITVAHDENRCFCAASACMRVNGSSQDLYTRRIIEGMPLAKPGFYLLRPGKDDNPVFSKCTPPSRCLGSNRCDSSHAGALCAQCVQGFTKDNMHLDDSASSGSCRRCPMPLEVTGYTFLVVVLYCLYIALLAGLTHASVRSSKALHSIIIKNFINYVQTVSAAVVATGLSSKVPSFLLWFPVVFIRPFELVAGMECLPTARGMPAFVIIGAVLIPAGLVVAGLAATAYMWWELRKPVQRGQEHSASPSATSSPKGTPAEVVRGQIRQRVLEAGSRWAMLATFALYPVVVRLLLEGILCTDMDMMRLKYDLDLVCSLETPVFLVSLSLLLFYGIGVPLVTFVLLHRVRKRLNSPEVWGCYSFLYNGFKTKSYYFEAVFQLRKFLLWICVAVPSIRVRVILMLALSVFCVALHLQVVPFDNRGYSVLGAQESAGLFALVLTLGLRLFFIIRDETLESDRTSPAYEAIGWELSDVLFIVVCACGHLSVVLITAWGLLRDCLIRHLLFRAECMPQTVPRWKRRLLQLDFGSHAVVYDRQTHCLQISHLSKSERHFFLLVLSDVMRMHLDSGRPFHASCLATALRVGIEHVVADRKERAGRYHRKLHDEGGFRLSRRLRHVWTEINNFFSNYHPAQSFENQGGTHRTSLDSCGARVRSRHWSAEAEAKAAEEETINRVRENTAAVEDLQAFFAAHAGDSASEGGAQRAEDVAKLFKHEDPPWARPAGSRGSGEEASTGSKAANSSGSELTSHFDLQSILGTVHVEEMPTEDVVETLKRCCSERAEEEGRLLARVMKLRKQLAIAETEAQSDHS
mmetsp:Transcript_60397/g.197650  ORF Transcript_60397/g.197650 Transcript_60397/m.197650 type:complete len:1409 (-) Transcript_60397:58-4284(-)